MILVSFDKSPCQSRSTIARTPVSRAAASLLVWLLSCRSTPSTGAEPQASLKVASKPSAVGKPVAAAPPMAAAIPTALAKAHGQLGPGGGVLLIGIIPPEGAELTPDAPISVQGSGGIGLSFPERLRGNLSKHKLPLSLPVEVEDGATGPVDVKLSYYWCTEGKNAACRREQVQLSVELDLTGQSAGGEAHFEYKPQLIAQQ